MSKCEGGSQQVGSTTQGLETCDSGEVGMGAKSKLLNNFLDTCYFSITIEVLTKAQGIKAFVQS